MIYNKQVDLLEIEWHYMFASIFYNSAGHFRECWTFKKLLKYV